MERTATSQRRFACVFVGGNYVAKLKFNYTKTPKYRRHRMTEGDVFLHIVQSETKVSHRVKKIHRERTYPASREVVE